MSASQKADRVICPDVHMSEYIFRSRFPRQITSSCEATACKSDPDTGDMCTNGLQKQVLIRRSGIHWECFNGMRFHSIFQATSDECKCTSGLTIVEQLLSLEVCLTANVYAMMAF